MMERTEDKGQQAIALVLRYGSLAATLLMAAGLALMLSHGLTAPGETLPQTGVHRLWAGFLKLDGGAIVESGILLMLLTPISRVVAAVGVFLSRREYQYVLVSLGVLAVVLVSIGLALRA